MIRTAEVAAHTDRPIRRRGACPTIPSRRVLDRRLSDRRLALATVSCVTPCGPPRVGPTVLDMSQERSERFHSQVLVEIDTERAVALSRIARRLELARARSEALAAAVDRGDHTDSALLDEHRRAHVEAEHWRWMLCVQREANGLYDHRWVDVIYPALRPR